MILSILFFQFFLSFPAGKIDECFFFFVVAFFLSLLFFFVFIDLWSDFCVIFVCEKKTKMKTQQLMWWCNESWLNHWILNSKWHRFYDECTLHIHFSVLFLILCTFLVFIDEKAKLKEKPVSSVKIEINVPFWN